MKYFWKIFCFLFTITASCGQKSTHERLLFQMYWEWKTPQNALIRDVTALEKKVFLTLNTGEIAFFSPEHPHEIQRLILPTEGLLTILWLTNLTNTYYGILWTTRGETHTLLWFSTQLSNTNNELIITPLFTQSYTQVYSLWCDDDSLWWAADKTIFRQTNGFPFPPQAIESIPFPYPYRIVKAARYKDILYLAQADKGLTILDIKRKKATNYTWIIGSIESIDIQPEEKMLFLGDRINGVRAYSIHNPWSPTFIAAYEALGNTFDIALSPEGIWMADQYNGISLLSFKDRTFSLKTNITGRVISRVMTIQNGRKLLLWHNDALILANVNDTP